MSVSPIAAPAAPLPTPAGNSNRIGDNQSQFSAGLKQAAAEAQSSPILVAKPGAAVSINA